MTDGQAGAAAPVRVRAKLTLSLRVTGVRADGFHELEALTVSVAPPADRVTVAAGPPGAIELQVTGATGDVPTDATNLVVRAARAALPPGLGFRIGLHKQIPPGAGLGGGSADAGVVLRILRDRFGADPEQVMAAAAALGSDIPFCVEGRPAWMRGRGELLEPVQLRGPLPVLVAVPPFALHTPPVYRAWDELGGPHSTRRLEPPAAVAHLTEDLVNDLEPAAEHVEPRLRPFRERLEELAGTRALLAGSGSACWIPFADAAARDAAGTRVSGGLDARTYPGTAT